jgi:acyl carrier protein
MDQAIVSQLSNFIANNILKQPRRVIAADEPLISSGLVDSFSLVDLALYVEDAYGVSLADTELNAAFFDTLAQLADLIQKRQDR